MNKYYMGIDGGGTKTAIYLMDENKKIISSSTGGPSSYDTVSLDEMKKNIQQAIASLNYNGEIVSVFAGLGGITSSKDSMTVIDVLKTIPELTNSLIEVENDVSNAFYGALGIENGIVCIIGTGSVAYGINNERTHRCGGYCYQEGDHGSSYDLGRKALQYYAKVVDLRLPKSDFSEDIKNTIKVETFSELANYIINSTRTDVASLAKLVTKHSYHPAAKKIIISAVDEMLEMINTVYRVLEFKGCNLSIVGSLGTADTYYKKYLLQELNENIKYIESKYEPVYGSCLKALANYERY